MKDHKRIQFLVVVFFMGILLSIMLYLGIGGMTSTAQSEEKQDTQILSFNRTFYEDESLQSLVKFLDYKFFRHIDQDGIIIGQSDWLFETEREDNGYDYLLDYVGGCPYTEDQLAKIAHTVALRREACEERGTEYVLVIIPNSMTSASDQLPMYLGSQSESTRMNQVMAYLEKNEETAVLDLRQAMKGTEEEPRYNNTEDSINAYGAFSVYHSVMSELSDRGREVDSHRLNANKIRFFTHYTEGKGIAKKAGLERVISNRTVSLSEDMADLYRISDVTEHCVTTSMQASANGNKQRVVMECSDEWDKIQLMPLFSNTFETVVYENSVGDGISSLDYHQGSILIQVIHESELDLLLR